MIGHPELLAHHLSDSRTGPQVGRRTRGLRASQRRSFQLPAMKAVKLGGAALVPSGSNPFLSPLAERRFSPTPATAHYPNTLRRLYGSIAVLQQSDGALTTTLQLLWAAGRSHDSSPAQSVGHYLCTCQ